MEQARYIKSSPRCMVKIKQIQRWALTTSSSLLKWNWGTKVHRPSERMWRKSAATRLSFAFGLSVGPATKNMRYHMTFVGISEGWRGWGIFQRSTFTLHLCSDGILRVIWVIEHLIGLWWFMLVYVNYISMSMSTSRLEPAQAFWIRKRHIQSRTAHAGWDSKHQKTSLQT